MKRVVNFSLSARALEMVTVLAENEGGTRSGWVERAIRDAFAAYWATHVSTPPESQAEVGK